MSLAIDVRMLTNSGIGTYLRHVLPCLISLRTEERFNLVGNSAELDGFPWSRCHNVAVVDCQSPIFSVDEQIRLPRLIPAQSDLFWSPQFNIPLFYRGKLLVTVHDVSHLALPQYMGGLHKRLYATTLFTALRRKANAIICDSQFTADELIRLAGVKASKITVVHLGVDEAWFSIPKKARPHGRPYFLFVGNVKPHKNLSALIAAFQSITDRISHDLVIVGKKEGFITADRMVMRRAEMLGERIRFTGFVDDPLLKQYFVHADAFVLPSLYEGFGLPPLEAMACGCPAIVSRAASLPEVCRDAAIYCDPRDIKDIADRMLYVVTHDSVRAELRERGVEHARRFTWDKCTRETGAVVERLSQ